jgi:hypothetical protein
MSAMGFKMSLTLRGMPPPGELDFEGYNPVRVESGGWFTGFENGGL